MLVIAASQLGTRQAAHASGRVTSERARAPQLADGSGGGD